MKTMEERGENLKNKITKIMNHFKRVREDLTFMKQEQETFKNGNIK